MNLANRLSGARFRIEYSRGASDFRAKEGSSRTIVVWVFPFKREALQLKQTASATIAAHGISRHHITVSVLPLFSEAHDCCRSLMWDF